MPAPIIMVHGAFCGGWAFERFKKPFEAAGHRCLTPNLPGHGAGERVTGLSMTDYAAAIAGLVAASDEPPVLIGHSLGGLVAQLAAVKSRAGALVLLSPSAPWGQTTMEGAAAGFGLLSLGAYWAQAVEPDQDLAHTFGLDGLPTAESKAAFARMTPESGRALGETFHWWLDPFMTTSVSPESLNAPVLVAAGGRDVVHAPASVRHSAERLGAEFKLYPEMAHWLVGAPGWEDVAGDCLAWIEGGVRVAA